MDSLAVTACQRCREQKLRCSRELPDCARCSRFGARCGYPAPPDRKVLATLRAHPKKRSSVRTGTSPRATADDHRHRHQPDHHSSTPSVFPVYPGVNDAPAKGSPIVDVGMHLTAAVQELFQETYFTCQFHSSLLFHRPTFRQAFEAGHVPQHVLFAMYANATIFLPSKSIIVSRNVDLLSPLGDLRALGRQLAIRAGRAVLQDIDQPTFESVKTCEMLSLFWFSAGEYQRNAMFLSIAYRAACILGLDTESGHACLTGASSALPHWLKAEMARRCFWAVWFTQCINSDHTLAGLCLSDKIMNLPLPFDEGSFFCGQEAPSTTLSAILDKPLSTVDTERPSRNSIVGELMVAMLFWARIRNLNESRTQLPAQDWLLNVYELEGRLTSWYSGMSERFSYTRRNLYEQLLSNQHSLFLFVHALYHQCRTVLHSSLVPQFSGVHLPETVPAEMMSVSARIALTSAQDISGIGADLVALDCDSTQIPGFVGYCMFVSASIHIAVLGSRDSTLKTCATTSLISSLKWLKSMKLYWSNLEKLWVRINVLYEAQMSRLRAPNITEVNALSARISQAPLKDLDQLAGEVRDASQLSEPLADSVLEYSLRRLRPTGNVQSRAMQELEDSSPLDQVSHLLEEDISTDVPPLTTSAAHLQTEQIMPMASMQDNQSALLPTSMSSGLEDWMRAPQIRAPEAYPWDWWGLGLDTLQQPILPYDYLFEFNGAM